MTKINSPDDLIRLRDKAKSEIDLREGLKDIRITVHMGTCGIAAGARNILAIITEELAAAKVDGITIQQTGCIGLCDQEPMISITKKTGEIYRYGRLSKSAVKEIVQKHILNGNAVNEYLIKG